MHDGSPEEVVIVADRAGRWHLDKTISVANIFVVLLTILAGFGAYDALTDRMAVLEANMDNLNNRVISLIERQINTDMNQDNDLQAFRSEMREDVRDIHLKLDRLIERNPND